MKSDYRGMSAALVLLTLLGPMLGGMVVARLTKYSTETWYQTLVLPNATPTKSFFRPAMTVLYLGMGFSSYLVVEQVGSAPYGNRRLRSLFGWYMLQLALNYSWSLIFFLSKALRLALFAGCLLALLVTKVGWEFYKVRPVAGILMLWPLLFSLFTIFINWAIVRLN